MTTTTSKTPEEEKRIIQIIKRKMYEDKVRTTADNIRRICAGEKEIEQLDDETLFRLSYVAIDLQVDGLPKSRKRRRR